MSPASILRGAVIAAGEGSRLPPGTRKPLLEVAGRALLQHTLDRYEAAGIGRTALIFRESDADLVEWTRRRYPDLDLEFVVRTTPSSAVSFAEVLRALGPGRAVVSTVDSVIDPAAFVHFLAAAAALPEDALVLAVTTWVDDEKPLWVDWDETGRVIDLGGKDGRGVTAGIYVAPHDAAAGFDEGPPAPPLRALLAAFFQSGRPTYAVPVPKVVDVDRPQDVREAEAFLEARAKEVES